MQQEGVGVNWHGEELKNDGKLEGVRGVKAINPLTGLPIVKCKLLLVKKKSPLEVISQAEAAVPLGTMKDREGSWLGDTSYQTPSIAARDALGWGRGILQMCFTKGEQNLLYSSNSSIHSLEAFVQSLGKKRSIYLNALKSLQGQEIQKTSPCPLQLWCSEGLGSST